MKKIFKNQITKLRDKVLQNPLLRSKITYIVNYFPNFKIRLKGLAPKSVHYGDWKSTRKENEFLVDVSHIYKEDLGTGVQRVVRSIMHYLEQSSPFGLDLQPIYLTDEDGYWCYKYVKSPSIIVVPKKGDIFLGLDLNKVIYIPGELGLFEDWKKRCVDINFIVYDILPIQFPQFYSKDVSIAYKLWLDTVINCSSRLVCISQSVCNDVQKYIVKNCENFLTLPKLDWFHLGADIENSCATKGIPSDANKILDALKTTSSFLMVSTIEPRKGHKQTLKAFEQLWLEGIDLSLVIAGKLGWMMDSFKRKLQNHPEFNKRLYWLEGISDEYLEKIYAASTCLIMPSISEGFGLPLIEAAQHKKPIIVRDIPVFNEVAGEFAYYFKDSSSPQVIAESIKNWLKLYETHSYPKSDKMPWLTWKESTEQLMNCMKK